MNQNQESSTKNSNRKLKKSTTIITIAAIALLLVLGVGIFLFNSEKPKTPTNEPTTQVEQQKGPTTISNSSWADGIWLAGRDKSSVEQITIVPDQKVDGVAYWSYDGINMTIDAGAVTIFVNGNLKITGLVERMFADMTNLKSIQGLEYIDFSESKSLKGMFQNCAKLQSVDVSYMNLQKAENLSYMFDGCLELKNIKFNMDKIETATDATAMFQHCSTIQSITLPQLPNVTTMENMFKGTGQGSGGNTTLKTQFNTSKCTNFNGMFELSGFVNYDAVTNMDTTSMTTASRMFHSSTIEELDLSAWKTSNLKDTSNMFGYCAHVIKINTNGWDCSSLETTEAMFEQTTSLTDLTLNWKNINQLKNVSKMFKQCFALYELNLTCFNGLHFENANEMFSGNQWTEKIKCSGFTADDSTEMFRLCKVLKGAESFNKTKLTAEMANTNGYFVE